MEAIVSPRRKVYSKEKIEEWREAFKIFDQDGNGQISRSELGTVMEQLGKKATDEELKSIIAEVDKDNSGTIDFNEFCDMMAKQETTIPEAELREVFNLFDSDKSGTISEAELLKVMQQLLGSSISPHEVSKMMKEADKDGNGQIDFTEYYNVLTSMPK